MTGYLDVPPIRSIIPYTFSCQLKNIRSVLTKLGAQEDRHRGVVTPSNSASILCALRWMKSLQPRRIVALCPCYFTVFQAGECFGMPMQIAHLKRSDGVLRIPGPSAAIWRNPSVLWLTNPVYGGGTYFHPDDIIFVTDLLKKGWFVVVDECLALPGRELIRTLGHYPNFVSIYSPHKAICVNGIKFSVVVFNRRYQTFMDRWCDVWYGGLGTSSLMAISHYLSYNYDKYAERFLAEVAPQRKVFNRLCAQFGAENDSRAEGHFVTCYFPKLSSRYGYSNAFLKTLMDKTGGSIICGNRARYSREFGFSFRVNLARKGPSFIPTLHRTVAYLATRNN